MSLQRVASYLDSMAMFRAILSPGEDGVPRHFGTYEIKKVLGMGGFGIVLLAWDRGLSRDLAVKLPRPDRLASEEFLRRFDIEARATAMLDHPHIVPIFEASRISGIPYIASAYSELGTLSRWIKDRQISPTLAAEILRDLADAVDHAHRRGVLHRDIKTSNVLLFPGTDADRPSVKLSDLGLAKWLDEEVAHTRTGAKLGTPGYMAPEQAAGRVKEIGVATDVYGLGSVLYELLTRSLPFPPVSDDAEMVRKVLEEEPKDPRSIAPEIPRDLSVITLKCLRKSPGDRYTSAAALREDLDRFLAGEPVLARSVSAIERLQYHCRRRPAIAALSTLLILVAMTGLLSVVWQWRRAEAALVVANDQREVAESRLESLERSVGELFVLLQESQLYDFDRGVGEDRIRDVLESDENENLFQQFPDSPRLQVVQQSMEARQHFASGNTQQALAKAQSAVMVSKKLVESNPSDSSADRRLAFAVLQLAQIETGTMDGSGESLIEVVLREAPPADALWRPALRVVITALTELALTHREQRRYDASLLVWRSIHGLSRALYLAEPANSEDKLRLAFALHQLAHRERGVEREGEKAAAMDECKKLLQELTTEHPENPAYHVELGHVLTDFAVAHRRRKRVDEAKKTLTEARVHFVKADFAGYRSLDYFRIFMSCHAQLAMLAREEKNYAEEEFYLMEVVSVAKEIVSRKDSDESDASRYAEVLLELAEAQIHLDKREAAAATLATCMEALANNLHERGPKKGLLILQARTHRNLGNLAAQSLDFAAARRHYQEGQAVIFELAKPDGDASAKYGNNVIRERLKALP